MDQKKRVLLLTGVIVSAVGFIGWLYWRDRAYPFQHLNPERVLSTRVTLISGKAPAKRSLTPEEIKELCRHLAAARTMEPMGTAGTILIELDTANLGRVIVEDRHGHGARATAFADTAEEKHYTLRSAALGELLDAIAADMKR